MKYLHPLILIVSFLFISTASADQYTDEMDHYIVDQCARMSVIYQDIDKTMDVDEAVTLLTSMTQISATIYDTVYKFIPKSDMPVTDLKTRKKIYGYALYNCIKGATDAFDLD